MSDVNTNPRTEEMSLLSALKEKKQIVKQMATNNGRIQQYSCLPASRKPLFESEAEQKKKVKELAQANKDLAERYAILTRRINYTNLMTIETIEGETRSLDEWLTYKRSLCKLMEATFMSMNDSNGGRRNNGYGGSNQSDNEVTLYFDEQFKISNLDKWQKVYTEIDKRIEVVNATTGLMTIPEQG